MEKSAIIDWIQQCRVLSNLHVKQINLQHTDSWLNKPDVIQHKTGRFFSIVGVKAIDKENKSLVASQPLIDQPEIGLLAFLFAKTPNGLEILLQAKTEPGNIGGTQIAPSVQATYSNYMQVHKGKPTKYLNQFIQEGKLVKEGSLQSEQGTRFLGKYNRNVSVFIDDKDSLEEPLEQNWRWFPFEELLALMDTDYLINTDARSVLITSDWHDLVVGKTPFASHLEGFGKKLYDSFHGSNVPVDVLLASLELSRKKKVVDLERCNLDEIPNWKSDANSITSEGTFSVNSYTVSVHDREVEEWSQPLVHSHEEGVVILYCKMIDGVLHFLVHHSWEIGFKEYVQFGPSVQLLDKNDKSELLYDDAEATLIANYSQSDEGGRFYQSEVNYSIKELPAHLSDELPEFYSWMTLRQVYEMLPQKGVFSNEFRSVLSLILKYI